MRDFSHFDVLIVVALLAILAAFARPALHAPRADYRLTKCSNNLRQLGFAMVQYGDDKRFLPHVNPILTLDGDNYSSDTTLKVRTLFWFGYHDDPEGFVCANSDDMAVPISDDALDNGRLWGWGGNSGAKGDLARDTTPPCRDGGAGADEALVDTSELSYALTRRGYDRNVASTKLLGADRGMRVEDDPAVTSSQPGHYGNHKDGWNVLKADCTVEFVRPDFDFGDGRSAYDHLSGDDDRTLGFLPLSEVARPVPN
ncbi:MAG: DUF1559 domain-containing protein [Planctomycetes bacterium]|nr:DUF1559 domain-containing protein [Planctomycetota bacterium]